MANLPPKKKPIHSCLSQFIPYLSHTDSDDAFKKEIYKMFHRYILRPKYTKMWGFPYVDEDGKVRYNTNHFSKLKESDVEKCRCGKQIFLQGKDWHLDENGCEFHPGKVLYSEEVKCEIYTCCNKQFPSSGCVRREHHVSAIRVCNEDDFVKTVQKKKSFLQCVPNIFALDCEMVYTTKGMEVVKVTVMTVYCDVVYDIFVKPRNPVIDYNTEFSGIDKTQLASATVELKDVQDDLLELLDTETILVGHGLENDLLCLNLHHWKVIDTSILFPHKKGFPFRYSLKQLASKYLHKEIHCDSKGHDSREDAKICIELVAHKVFHTRNKEMVKKYHHMQSFVNPYFQPNNVPNKINGFPGFGPRPPHPMNWNYGFNGYPPRPPPPAPYTGGFFPGRHPLLSFPLYNVYQKKLNPMV